MGVLILFIYDDSPRQQVEKILGNELSSANQTAFHSAALPFAVSDCRNESESFQPATSIDPGLLTIQETTTLGDLGSFAVFADPFGTEFAARQGENKVTRPANGLGTFAWTELTTDDLPAVSKFYGDLFGWTLGAPLPGDQLGRREWLVNGRPIAGLLPRPSNRRSSRPGIMPTPTKRTPKNPRNNQDYENDDAAHERLLGKARNPWDSSIVKARVQTTGHQIHG
jgi:predicted enzyme related to lactoylglutathione lyase